MCKTSFLGSILVGTLVWMVGCSSSAPQDQKVSSPKGDAFKLTSEQEKEVERNIDAAVSTTRDRKKDNAEPTSRDEVCIEGCKSTYRNKVKEYYAIFESKGSVHYHDTRWLSEVLANARNEFDACLATCD